MDLEILGAFMDNYKRNRHLLISMTPDVAPVKLINTLKTGLSREVHLRYKEHIEKYLWGDSPFWSASYFCATTGSVSMETVKKYIEEQRTDDHRRKYEKSGNYPLLYYFLRPFAYSHLKCTFFFKVKVCILAVPASFN